MFGKGQKQGRLKETEPFQDSTFLGTLGQVCDIIKGWLPDLHICGQTFYKCGARKSRQLNIFFSHFYKWCRFQLWLKNILELCTMRNLYIFVCAPFKNILGCGFSNLVHLDLPKLV